MRFAFTSGLAWKAVKLYVAEKGGTETLVPKDAYRAAQRMQLLTPEETETALGMVDDRNRLAHDYSEEFARALYRRIKDSYAPLMRQLLERIK